MKMEMGNEMGTVPSIDSVIHSFYWTSSCCTTIPLDTDWILVDNLSISLPVTVVCCFRFVFSLRSTVRWPSIVWICHCLIPGLIHYFAVAGLKCFHRVGANGARPTKQRFFQDSSPRLKLAKKPWLGQQAEPILTPAPPSCRYIGRSPRHTMQWWGLNVFYGAVEAVPIGARCEWVERRAPPFLPAGHSMRRV